MLLTFVLSVLFADFILYVYIDKKTTKERFVDELSSKTKHMLLNAKEGGSVFIGSSRTLYQIDSDYFRQNGIDAYNYGVSGRHLANYSYMVENALSTKPKCIVIGLDFEKVYEPIGEYLDFPKPPDIKNFIRTSQGIDVVFEATLQYLKNLHLLNTYDTVIYERLKGMFLKLHPQASNTSSQQTLDNGNRNFDCDYFEVAYNRGSHSHETLVKCKDGDGIIYGNAVDEQNSTKLVEVNEKHFGLLTTILDAIKDKGVKSVIILLPKYGNPYEYEDIESMIKKINADKVINMTNADINKSLWGDYAHLNNYGRRWYSEFIFNNIKDICK